MNRRQQLFPIAIALLVLAAMACTCTLPKPSVSGPAPKATVPVSQAAADNMQKKLDQAVKQAKSTGQFKLTLTESELSSYLAQEITKSQEQGDQVPITNPQVKLTQGQVWVYGTFGGSAKLNGLVVVLPQIQDDQLKIQIVRVDFGPVPVPKPLLDQMNEQIQTATQENTSNIILTSIVIREGEMDVTGKTRQ
jgi:hypothetical protein